MPLLPITLVTQNDMASSSRRQYHRFYRPIVMSNGHERVAYIAYTINDGTTSGDGLDGPSIHDLLPNRRPPQATAPSTSTSLSASSSRKKRKSTALNVSLLSQNDFVTLSPKTQTIIERCFSSPSTPPAETTSAQAGGNKKKGPTVQEATDAITTNRWSRATDLGNNRSNIPSPQEVARSKIKEQERAKARVEAAAQKRIKRNRRRGSNGTTTRNQSPQDKEEANPTSSAANNDTSASATKTDPPASNTSNNPFPSRVGLKRTRSVGVPPISSNLANSLGAGAPAVSSPLKAVTGPNTPEEGDQPRKRSRLSDPTDEKSPRAETEARKASSLSPQSTAVPLPLDPTPNTVPSATLPLKLEATEMRRAASASNIGANSTRGSRRSSFGIDALAARERSKREVTLPGRLKDYDVRASTPA